MMIYLRKNVEQKFIEAYDKLLKTDLMLLK